jgi:hypothetical protein
MRRLIVGVAVGCAALLAGCSDANTTTQPTTAPGTATTSPAPSRDPRAAAICDDLHRNVLDVDAKAFGTELGKMISARTQGNKAEETRAQQAAVAKLTEIAGKLRTHANEATDPQLKSALTASASNLEQIAADTDGLSKLNSLDAVGQTTARFATALSEIADYCSASPGPGGGSSPTPTPTG